jgi:hypothetical protein
MCLQNADDDFYIDTTPLIKDAIELGQAKPSPGENIKVSQRD